MSTGKPKVALAAFQMPNFGQMPSFGGSDIVETAKAQFAKAAETQFKTANDVAALGKSNVEAMIQAGSIFFRGFEEITRSMVGLTQANLEANITTAKALMGVKTLTDITDLQSGYAKSSFDHAVTEATKLLQNGDFGITNEAV